MKKVLVFLFFLLHITPSLWAKEKLLYAIRYQGPARAPIKGNQISTQIFSISPDSNKSKLVFSDENCSIALSVVPNVSIIGKEEFVTGRRKLYCFAIGRNIEIGYDSSGRPLHYYRFGMKSLIYELFIDGTNRFKKVCEVMGTQCPSMMCIDPTGRRIGYLNYSEKARTKSTLFIHSTLSGKLLNKVDLSEILLDCFVSSIGWLADGNRLFFTLDTGDVHVTSEESYEKVGAYLMKEDGTDLVKLPQSLILFPEKKGFSDQPGGAQFIGQLSDGTYIFRDFKFRKGYRGTAASSFIHILNPITNSRREIPLKISEGLGQFKVSHDGTKIGFDVYEDDSIHIWVKDLKTGKENRIFSFPVRRFKGYYLGLIGWIED